MPGVDPLNLFAKHGFRLRTPDFGPSLTEKHKINSEH